MLCRCCGMLIDREPLLVYHNMPSGAQSFLAEEEIKDERGKELIIHECPCCGLVQLEGEPVPYYKDVIRASKVSAQMHQFRLEYFEEFVNRYGLKNKRIIEIGAGCGEYMQIMGLCAAKVCGLEHNGEAVEIGRKAGLEMYQGYIEDASQVLPNGPYDAFYINNFLEHVPEPNIFLKGIVNNLTDDAVGIVEVPNLEMILDRKLFSEFIQDHLVYYTKNTLKLMLEKNGLEVIDCSVIWSGYIIAATVRRRRGIQVEEFKKQHEKLKKSVHEFLAGKEAENKAIAVWGAGHQALADLALLSMQNRVKYVVDSAEFKQNKYTPVTHLRIVSPSELSKGEVQTVIAMAGGYNDEVIKILRKDYPEIEIAVIGYDGIELCDKI